MGEVTMKLNDPRSLRGPLGISLAALVVIVLFLVFWMPSLYGSGATVFTGGPEKDDSLTKLVAMHDTNMQTDVDRFNGRSFFYEPPVYRKPPPPPPPKPVVVEPPKPVEPPKKTYPSTYTGPKLIAIIGNEAWFREKSSDMDPKTRVSVGESHDDIELISTNPPSGIQLKYRGGGPYDVQLFDMDATPFDDQPLRLQMPSGILQDVDDTPAMDMDHHDGENPCTEKMEGVDLPISDHGEEALDSPTPPAGDTLSPEAEEADPVEEPASEPGEPGDPGAPEAPEAPEASPEPESPTPPAGLDDIYNKDQQPPTGVE